MAPQQPYLRDCTSIRLRHPRVYSIEISGLCGFSFLFVSHKFCAVCSSNNFLVPRCDQRDILPYRETLASKFIPGFGEIPPNYTTSSPQVALRQDEEILRPHGHEAQHCHCNHCWHRLRIVWLRPSEFVEYHSSLAITDPHRACWAVF